MGEREGEKHQCVVASYAPPSGDLAHNPGMCPKWGSNERPFGPQVCTQSRATPARAVLAVLSTGVTSAKYVFNGIALAAVWKIH